MLYTLLLSSQFFSGVVFFDRFKIMVSVAEEDINLTFSSKTILSTLFSLFFSFHFLQYLESFPSYNNGISENIDESPTSKRRKTCTEDLDNEHINDDNSKDVAHKADNKSGSFMMDISLVVLVLLFTHILC